MPCQKRRIDVCDGYRLGIGKIVQGARRKNFAVTSLRPCLATVVPTNVPDTGYEQGNARTRTEISKQVSQKFEIFINHEIAGGTLGIA